MCVHECSPLSYEQFVALLSITLELLPTRIRVNVVIFSCKPPPPPPPHDLYAQTTFCDICQIDSFFITFHNL